MVLDGAGALWVDISDEGAVSYLARRGCSIPLTTEQQDAIAADLAHLGVKRVRPFCHWDN
jgi:hypothetical protein